MKNVRRLYHFKNSPLFCIILLALALTACAQQQVSTTSTTTPPTETNPDNRPVRQITTLVDSAAKTLDWSHKLNKLTIEKYGADTYVDIYVINPDGTGEQCLTCDKPDCPQKHNGNSAWHPSGEYIVFTAEKEKNPDYLWREAVPGSGFNNDLWLMTADGQNFFRLTDYPLHARAVIHPHFSHDGKLLFWAERLRSAAGSGWGTWALKIADFIIENDKPTIKNIHNYQPGRNRYFYESHAFSPDDSKILFSANPDGQTDSGFDIYTYDLYTGQLTNLTNTPDDWDEHAQYSPDGNKIAWMSATELNIPRNSIKVNDFERGLITELWIMNADGSNKQRLTYFNQPGYAEYMNGQRVIVSDISWSPDGKTIAALIAYWSDNSLKSKIVLIELRQSTEYEGGGKLMTQKKVQLTSKQADGYVISLGQINLVFVTTDKGMVGCGAFDVAALNNFSYPAAKVKSQSGKPIATIDDLLEGIVKEVNAEAAKLGITIGMSGREALDLM